MDWIRAVMLVSGLLTMTMISAALAPHHVLQSTFGASLDGPVAEIVVRNWGVLIALVGVMLAYGAFRPAVRALVLAVASASKLAFVLLLWIWARPMLGGPAGVVLASDVIQVVLLTGCLAATARKP